MSDNFSGNEIRKTFIEYFKSKGHKFVPSSSLVPGGDQTLLFTNAGMVQFKDVFLGKDSREYSRAVNSQKCMRVAGKHNDLEDVGRDDTHHTFFEMLGNWSFGDYYKKEAIVWAWDLLTEVWKLEKTKLWVTCFKDEKGEIETDTEAVESWQDQPGINPDHILLFGRKDNFWEMAETGPSGPCSEIHYDRGEIFCDKSDDPEHVCKVNGDCHRFLELWNLVFIQYNRLGPSDLEPLPAKHVDTGMGFERIVSVLQEVDSNYRTDLLFPLIEEVRSLSGETETQRDENFTPYRVIADHTRAATFLIADGVVPGNIGRNYICRMIIRRASRFGSQIGLDEPFMGDIAKKVISIYGDTYPELKKNKQTILDNLTREEDRFQLTVESGLAFLDEEITKIHAKKKKRLDGEIAFDLYTTHGLPLEITKDVLRESGLDVDQEGFYEAMEAHRISSGAGKEFGQLGGEGAKFYLTVKNSLVKNKDLKKTGVLYDPYELTKYDTKIISIIENGKIVKKAGAGSKIEIVTPETGFYMEAGGQVSDHGMITAHSGNGKIEISDVRKPAAGLIVHIGKVLEGRLSVGDEVHAVIDNKRRQDIMRNHTATHLLHAELRKVLGEHVRQAGSLVAPDRLRFDFTHPEALTKEEIHKIEDGINISIYDNYQLNIADKPLDQAMDEGAMALFGEKYGEVVRTVSIDGHDLFSYELCGGTHVHETAEIGVFLIISEGSAAAGIRRIEAVTGRKAYEVLSKKYRDFQEIASELEVDNEHLIDAVIRLKQDNNMKGEEINKLKFLEARALYAKLKEKEFNINGVKVIPLILQDMSVEIMRRITDLFREDFSSGIIIIGNIDKNQDAQFIAAVTEDLVKKGYHAGKIVKSIASEAGGSGGGRPQLAQAGAKSIKEIGPFFDKLEKHIHS